MNEVRSGRLRLLYVAPERFVNERVLQRDRADADFAFRG